MLVNQKLKGNMIFIIKNYLVPVVLEE